MRAALATVAAGAAVMLAAGLAFPTAAQAATASVAGVPTPPKSLIVAGYEQEDCQPSTSPMASGTASRSWRSRYSRATSWK